MAAAAAAAAAAVATATGEAKTVAQCRGNENININRRWSNQRAEELAVSAALSGNLALLAALVRSKGPTLLTRTRSIEGCMPIHIAARHGHTTLVLYMLDHGNSLHDRDGLPRRAATVLHYACWGGCKELVALLLLYGADALDLDLIGNPPLLYAVFAGAQDVCEMLLAHGCPVDTVNSKGHNAMLQAACGGHTQLVAWLHNKHGLSLFSRDFEGNVSVCYVLLTGVSCLLKNK
jgi:ankyrin repeat protein